MHHELSKLGWIVLALSVVPACRFSASGSAEASTKTGADANAQASFDANAQTPPAQPQPEPKAIKLVGSRLDYRGVINFEYDKAALQNDETTKKTLDEFKKYLEQHAGVAIEVQGHTDSRGSDEYNRKLSDRRAATVRGWLIEHGIAADRITSIGKGEDAPQIPEPDQCNDKEPEDTKPCEQAWAANRRVVFEVTKGAETIKEEPAPPPPAVAAPAPPAAPAPAPASAEECPWLWGGHANVLGPNSWVTLAGATQPGVCWLELSLGLGLGFGSFDATSPANVEADGDFWSLTVPFRARIWFFDRHSLIGDAGIGISHFWVSADAKDPANNSFEYSRDFTAPIAHLGLGYGFRPNRSQAGFRFAIVVGGLLTMTEISDSEFTAGGTFNAADAAALASRLDDDTEELDDFKPYGEASFGLLF